MSDLKRMRLLTYVQLKLKENENNKDFEYLLVYTKNEDDYLHAAGEMCGENLCSTSLRMAQKAIADLPEIVKMEVSVQFIRKFLSMFDSETLAKAITIGMLNELSETELMEYLD